MIMNQEIVPSIPKIYKSLTSLALVSTSLFLGLTETALASPDSVNIKTLLDSIPKFQQEYTSLENSPHTKLMPDSLVEQASITKQSKEQYHVGRSIVRRAITSSLPMVFLAIPYTQTNKYIRDVRNDLYPKFKYKYDDYLQFSPLVAQLALRSFGVKGYSESVGQMLLSDALGVSIMMGTVYGMKTIISVRRPDGSAENSFPSGHTAMAFSAATLLSLEYGDRYPWISLASYLSATSVGVGRVLNNRHWAGDVIVGATIGIVSSELGYWLSDLITHRPTRRIEDRLYFSDTDLRLSLPWSRGFTFRSGFDAVDMGFGLRWVYSPKGYLIFSEAQLESRLFHEGTEEESFLRNYLVRFGWGKKTTIIPQHCSIDATAGLAFGHKDLFPFIRLSPRLKLSKRLSWRIDASYEFRHRWQSVHMPNGEVENYKPSSWRLGSAFEVRL